MRSGQPLRGAVSLLHRAKAPAVAYAYTPNHTHPAYPDLEDFGEAVLRSEDGTDMYLRVDWLAKAALGTWGDVRIHIVGSEGTLEMRKTLNLGFSQTGKTCCWLRRQGSRPSVLKAGWASRFLEK